MENQFVIETIETKSGHLTLKVNDYFLHSKYNPIIEAQKFAEKQYEPHHVHILFGYGLGYVVDSLKEQFKFDEPLIVIEPLFDDSLIEVQARHKVNGIDSLLYNSKSVKKLEYILEDIREIDYPKNFKVICSANFDKLFPELYLEVLKEIRDTQQISIVNENTINKESETWQRNLSENLLSIYEDRRFEKLHQVYSCPVIIASGGPSLTKQLELLKENKDKVIIIAAGTTINSLLAYGIEPDYVVSIDGSDANYNSFIDLNLNKAQLIYTVFNHPKIRDKFNNFKHAFMPYTFNPVYNYFCNRLGIVLPRINGGGSVSQYVFDIAQYISSGPIALIGQDLAYTNNQTHADNNKQVKSIDESWKTSDSIFTVEGFDGEDVWTSTMFYSMKISFEQMIEESPPKNIVYNCTEGGVRLKGFEQKSFNDFCEEYIQDVLPNKELEIENQAYIVSHGEWKSLKKILEGELKSYDQIIKHLLKGIAALENNKSNSVFNDKTLKKLDKVDKEIEELYPTVQMDFIVSPITLEVLKGFLEKENETPVEKYTRVYNQTKTLYSKLLEATKKSKMYTENVIKRIDSEKIIKSEEL